MKTPGSKRKLKKRNIKKCVELLLKGIIRYTLFDIANGKAEYRSDAFNFLMSDTCKRYCSIIGFSYDNYIKKLFGGPEGIPNTTIGIARFLKIHEGTLYQHIKKGIIKYPEGGRGKGEN